MCVHVYIYIYISTLYIHPISPHYHDVLFNGNLQGALDSPSPGGGGGLAPLGEAKALQQRPAKPQGRAQFSWRRSSPGWLMVVDGGGMVVGWWRNFASFDGLLIMIFRMILDGEKAWIFRMIFATTGFTEIFCSNSRSHHHFDRWFVDHFRCNKSCASQIQALVGKTTSQSTHWEW